MVQTVMRDMTDMIDTEETLKEMSTRQVIETLIEKRSEIDLGEIKVIEVGIKGMGLGLEKVLEMLGTMIENTKTTADTKKESKDNQIAKKTTPITTNELTQDNPRENTLIMTTTTQKGTIKPKGMKMKENPNFLPIKIPKKVITKEGVINRRKQGIKSGSTRSIWSRRSQRVIQR